MKSLFNVGRSPFVMRASNSSSTILTPSAVKVAAAVKPAVSAAPAPTPAVKPAVSAAPTPAPAAAAKPAASAAPAPAAAAKPAASAAPAATFTAEGVRIVDDELDALMTKGDLPTLNKLFMELNEEKATAKNEKIWEAQAFWKKKAGTNGYKIKWLPAAPLPDISAEILAEVQKNNGPGTLQLVWKVSNKEKSASTEALWAAQELFEMSGITSPGLPGLAPRPIPEPKSAKDITRQLKIDVSAKNMRYIQMHMRDIVSGKKEADEDVVKSAEDLLRKMNFTVPKKDTRSREEKEAEIEALNEKLAHAKLSGDHKAAEDLKMQVKWRTEEMKYSEGEAEYC